jgi:hypothetical protein
VLRAPEGRHRASAELQSRLGARLSAGRNAMRVLSGAESRFVSSTTGLLPGGAGKYQLQFRIPPMSSNANPEHIAEDASGPHQGRLRPVQHTLRRAELSDCCQALHEPLLLSMPRTDRPDKLLDFGGMRRAIAKANYLLDAV